MSRSSWSRFASYVYVVILQACCFTSFVQAQSTNQSIDICFQEAGARHGIAPVLLQAIAIQESAMQAHALNRNRDGSFDMGLMQINSRWLSTLARYGIRPEQLWDPCVSVHVGAWILAGNFRRLGHSWEAVGAYNASSPSLRMRYAQAVGRKLEQLKRQSGPL